MVHEVNCLKIKELEGISMRIGKCRKLANCIKNQIEKVNKANINLINKQRGKEFQIKYEPKTLLRCRLIDVSPC